MLATIVTKRAYLRNGIAAWPVETQRTALSQAAFDGPVYEDALASAQLRRRKSSALTQRAAMLGECREGETLFVASLTCLALDTRDLTTVLDVLGMRGVFVRLLDIEREIPPGVVNPELIDVLNLWDEARRAQQTLAGRGKGAASAAQAARERREKALAIARPLWNEPDLSADQIAARAGVCVMTLYNHLGTRRGRPS